MCRADSDCESCGKYFLGLYANVQTEGHRSFIAIGVAT